MLECVGRFFVKQYLVLGIWYLAFCEISEKRGSLLAKALKDVLIVPKLIATARISRGARVSEKASPGGPRKACRREKCYDLTAKY
jgi:hypothetical protein